MIMIMFKSKINTYNYLENDMKLSKQERRILNQFQMNSIRDFDEHGEPTMYDQWGAINPLDSWNKCGVYRLSAVIHNLRKKGLHIVTRDKKVTNQFGEGCTVGEYLFDIGRT